MESQLEQQCGCDYDYELVQDIQGRMILHWNYRNLREIPDEVLNYGEHIEEIYLKRNCLEKLPTNIGKLCNLTNLYLVGNQLEELPNEVGNLKCLKVLDISQNYIQKLPLTIGDLNLLESLLLTYNQLGELPKCLRKLNRLKQLEVSGNRIYTIPSTIIEGLESLEEFGIDRNPISCIPRNICLLKNLRYFSACRCNLLFLPSLPFHSLYHGNQSASRSSRSQSSSNSGPLNSNRNLQFLFDGNPRLNYIPYWVLQLLGSNVECFGCGLDIGESDNGESNPIRPHETSTASAETQLLLYTYWSDVNRPKIKLNFKGKRRTLHFDEDIVKLHHSSFNGNLEEAASPVKATVVSLLELCLRQVHQLGLLEQPDMRYCGVKPVVEPLIVPQRAGNVLINMKGGTQAGSVHDETVQSMDIPMHTGKCIFRGSCSSSSGSVAPSSSGAGNCEKVLSFSEKKGDQVQIHHNMQTSSHKCSVIETGSTRPEEKKMQEEKEDEEENVSRSQEEDVVILPAHLQRILMSGPVAKCFECLKPIFIETWPIIFHISGRAMDENVRERMRGAGGGANDIRGDWDDMQDGKLSIGCAHFCSNSCVTRFRGGTKFSSNLVLNDLRCVVENELQWVVVK